MMDFAGKNIVERIDKLLVFRNEKRKAVCDYADISVQTITDWDKRGSIPASHTLYKIAKYFDVTVEYLLTGEDDFTETERELLQAFKNLDERGRIAAIGAVKALAASFPAVSSSTRQDETKTKHPIQKKAQ
jgi:transcriptional regulator with XRE-family HTH domain